MRTSGKFLTDLWTSCEFKLANPALNNASWLYDPRIQVLDLVILDRIMRACVCLCIACWSSYKDVKSRDMKHLEIYEMPVIRSRTVIDKIV
jgi:hypothetical protein